MPDTAIAVLTRDLRVHDNPVLAAAAESARQVVPLFVHDAALAKTGFASAPRTRFLQECLADLDAGLRRRGAALVVREGDLVTEVGRLAEEVDAASVHIAADVSGFAARRERRLTEELGMDQPDLRAALCGSQIVGLGMIRYVVRLEPLASADHDTVVAAVAPNLQRYLTGDLTGAA